MAELEQIFESLDYAETIEHTIGTDESALTVTIAEANPVRNPAYRAKFFKLAKEEGVAIEDDLSRAATVDLVTSTLLKGWDAQRDGKPVPIGEAADILKANVDKGGFQICSTILLVARMPAAFKGGASKKKPSPTTSPKPSRSETKPKSSKIKPKAAASRPRRGSKAT